MGSPGSMAASHSHVSKTVAAGKLPPLLKGFLLALVVLTVVSTGAELWWHFVSGRGYPYDSPFVAPISRFDDLIDWPPRFRSLHTEAFFSEQPPVVYPAPMSMLYGGLTLLGGAALPAYLCLAGLIAAGGAALTVRKLRRHGIGLGTGIGVAGILIGTSYPFWFVVYTANLELVVFLCLAAGLLLFCHRRPYLAAVCFAVAGALKWTPFLFFLLLLRRRYWQALGIGLLVAGGVILMSLWGVYPDIARSWQETRAGADLFVRRDGLHNLAGQLGFDHSLLALIKFFGPRLTPQALTRFWGFFAPLTGLAVAGLWFGRIRRLTLPEQVLFLTVCLVLLPPVSYDYTLVELYLPGALLFGEILRRGEAPAGRWFRTLLACFAVVLTAQGYILPVGVHRSAQLKAVALLGLLGVSIVGMRRSDVSVVHSHFMQPEPGLRVL